MEKKNQLHDTVLCRSVSGLGFFVSSATNFWRSSLIFVELEEPHIFPGLLHDYQRRQSCKRLFSWSKRDRTPQNQANASWKRHTELLLHISKLSPNWVWLQLCALWLPAALKSDTIEISVRWLRTPTNISHKFYPSRGCYPVRRTLLLAGGCCGRASASGSAWLKPTHDGKPSLNSSTLEAVQEHAIKY